MRCAVLALGSRGDVQPLLALASGLRSRGVDVRFAAPVDYREWVLNAGLEFFPLTAQAASFFSGPAGTALRERSRDKREFQRFFQDYLGTFLAKLLVSCFEATRDADAILSWSWTRAGPSLAEKLGVPLFVVSPNPVLHLPTSRFANPFQGPDRRPPLGRFYNRYSWRWAVPFTQIGQSQVDAWRVDTLGLDPLPWRSELRTLRRLPHLLGYSPSVLPKPRDWAGNVHVTGYWFMERSDAYEPSADLLRFLEDGEPPIAVGFSSQVGGSREESRRVNAALVEGLRDSGRRALLISGWGALKGVQLSDDMFRVESVPYDWLMPRISGMVHQGGSGSTAEALRGGVPSVAVPFGYEQMLWGQRIAKLGAGPPPIPAASLTAGAVTRAVAQLVEDGRFRSRAAAVATRVKAEDGVNTAVDIIERGVSMARAANGPTACSLPPEANAPV